MDKAPNILLITSDQQHWNTIGAFNNEIITKNIDRLVSEGTTYQRAYCPNPTCTPARASIITGMYPSQHGAYALGTKLPAGEHTVCEDFTKNGYRTALIGKAHFQPLASTPDYPAIESRPEIWDFDFWKNFYGPYYGFEHVELVRGHTNESDIGLHYANWMEEKGCKNWKDYYLPPTGNANENEIYNWKLPEEYHYDTWIAERTNAMLEQYKNNNEKFFLWASFPDPHPKYIVSEPWDSMYDPDRIAVPHITEGEQEKNPPHFRMSQMKHPDFSGYRESGQKILGLHSHLHNDDKLKKDIAVYYGMVSMMDKYIGVILDKLDELGMADNTIVVFTSDHGHFIGQHGLIAKGPFHYEDMIKIPFVVRWPGVVPEGKMSDSLISLVDLAPTFLSACKIPIPRSMSGVDQSGVWSGEVVCARDHILCENHYEPTTMHLKTYVNKRYKLTVYYNKTYGELFDLEKDPGEIDNLWDNPDYKEIKAGLLLEFIWGEMGKEPLWMPRICFA